MASHATPHPQHEGDWIVWAGGTSKPPVEGNTLVEVKVVGCKTPLDPAPAFMFRWGRANRCQSPEATITSYRVVRS